MTVNLPVVNAPYLSVDGLEITITGDATATVEAGRARNSSNESDIIMTAQASLNVDNNGLNGLDTGSMANNTLYALYVVGDSSLNNDPGVILSANMSSPLLPVGYDMYRKIGYLRSDATADFLPGYFSGKSNERTFMYDAPLATAITAGAAVVDTAVSLANIVPAVAGTPVYMFSDLTPSAAGRTMSLKPFGATGFPVVLTGQVATVHVTSVDMVQAQLNSGAPSIEYVWSAGGGDAVALNVAGYQYTI